MTRLDTESSRPLDWSRPIQTRDGRKARLVCNDFQDPDCPYLVLITDGMIELIRAYRDDGYYADARNPDNPLRIINIPAKPARIKRTVWLNIYPNEHAIGAHKDKSEADMGNTNRIACVRMDIDCSEGEGL